jgi:tubulin gamma
MTKLFAPGNTPDPNRKFRESTAQPTPRGMAAKATDKELFAMRIESPPADLTGEALAAKVPKDWNSKGSIYADQFLAHLCPPEFDDEQRRQFFCILDLRRLKYAADEIFSKKDWKLNIINFAKEFEKSRSIILLRYGLYEFQNVKPSKEILRRWRREHGLPDPEDDESAPTPSKSSAAKKRKADDDATDNATPSLASGSKRRAMDKEKVDAPVAQPSLNKNKRKASLSDESESQPTKLAKPTSSASAALFGQIAEKHKSTPTSTPTTAKQSTESSAPKPSLFASKPTNGGLARSVFSNLKSGPSQAGSSSNIFGYLSDASSAKNSGVEADAESEADSDQEDSQEAGQSDEPSVAASGGADTASQIGFGLLSKQPAPAAGLATASSSAPGTRESTPGRSLFDRVTKTSDGQLARADVTEPAATERSEPLDQTWNPSNTPIKFAPSNASKPASTFGVSTSAQSTSTFAPKFGTAKGEQSSDKAASKETTPATTDKEANESDKENDGQASKKSLFETKSTSAQSAFGSSLFSTKPAAAEPAKEAEAPKPATNLFGSAVQASAKPDAPAAAPSTAASLFGAAAKPAATTPGTSTPTPVMQSSTLFGANTSAAQTPTESTTPKPAPLFGAAPAASSEATKPSSLFAPKSATNGGNLFGSASPAPSQPLFGAPSTSAVPEPEKKKPSTSEASSQPTPAPIFSFGASQPKDASQPAKPLFSAPRSPPSGTATNSLFSGSPMKQDEPSPAKRAFTGASGSGSAAPSFSFGSNQSQPSSNLFGAASSATPNAAAGGSINFGGATSNAGTGSFNFSFGGAGASTSTISNPFSGGSTGNDKPASAAPASGGMFSFGGASTPSTGGASSFQFGGAPSATPAAPSGGSIFGGQANSSTPAFGGTPSASGTPVFNFTSASPQPGQGNGSMFGSNTPAPAFGNLQPPAGGASTTGTSKSPFPHRKIAPLKRRV